VVNQERTRKGPQKFCGVREGAKLTSPCLGFNTSHAPPGAPALLGALDRGLLGPSDGGPPRGLLTHFTGALLGPSD